MDCNICSENLLTKTVVSTSCGHLHHQDCLNRWFQNTKTCPDCRSDQRNKTPIQIFFPLSNNKTKCGSDEEQDRDLVLEQTLISSENKIKEIEEALNSEKIQSFNYKEELEKLKNEEIKVEVFKKENLKLIEQKKIIQSDLTFANEQKKITNNRLNSEKKKSKKLKKELDDCLNENKSLGKENHRLVEKQNANQSKLNLADENIKKKDESLKLEKELSLKYKTELEESLNKINLMEKENHRLVEEKNANQSKLNSADENIKKKNESLNFEKLQSLKYQTQIEKSIHKIKLMEKENLQLFEKNEDFQFQIISADENKKKMEKNKKSLEIEIATLRNQIKEVESIKNENLRLVGENEKIVSLADDYKKKIEQNKRYLKLERKKSRNFRKQLNNLNYEFEGIKNENFRLVEENNNIQSQLNWTFSEKNQLLNNIKEVKRTNFQLTEEKKAIQIQLNLVNQYKNKMEKTEKLFEAEKCKSCGYFEKIKILNNEIKSVELIKKENIRLVEENKNIQSQWNLTQSEKNNLLNKIKIIEGKNFQLAEEKNAIQLKLNSAKNKIEETEGLLKENIQRLTTCMESFKNEKLRLTEDYENLLERFNFINSENLNNIEKYFKLDEEKKAIQLKLNSANQYKNKMEETERLLILEKRRSFYYGKQVEMSNNEVKKLIEEKNLQLKNKMSGCQADVVRFQNQIITKSKMLTIVSFSALLYFFYRKVSN